MRVSSNEKNEGLVFLNNTAVLVMAIPISKIKSIDVPNSAQRSCG